MPSITGACDSSVRLAGNATVLIVLSDGVELTSASAAASRARRTFFVMLGGRFRGGIEAGLFRGGGIGSVECMVVS